MNLPIKSSVLLVLVIFSNLVNAKNECSFLYDSYDEEPFEFASPREIPELRQVMLNTKKLQIETKKAIII